MIVKYLRYLIRDLHRRSVSYLSRVDTFHMAPNLYNLAKKLSWLSLVVIICSLSGLHAAPSNLCYKSHSTKYSYCMYTITGHSRVFNIYFEFSISFLFLLEPIANFKVIFIYISKMYLFLKCFVGQGMKGHHLIKLLDSWR